MVKTRAWAIAGMLAIGGACGAQEAPPEAAGVHPELRSFHEEAARLRPTVETVEARLFLEQVEGLEPITPRTVYYRSGENPAAYTSAETGALSDEERAGLRAHDVTTRNYYSTFYGSPLAYVRALDLVLEAGLESFDGKRIVDMGYGQIGQLELMAMCGAEVVGIEVLPLLRAMYAHEGDQGEVTGTTGRRGSVRLVHGYWPAGEGVAEAVGGGFDLFISRNTLKRGYVHPAYESRYPGITLGVDDEAFVARIHEILAPGGFAMIYNIGLGDPQEGEAYVPATDIHTPFPREMWEEAGFEIIAFDVDDREAVAAFGDALGWDERDRPYDLAELRGRYTIARRPR